MLSNDLHVMSLCSCKFFANSLTIFKGITVDISVVEKSAVLSYKVSKNLNNQKHQKCVLLVLLLPVWYQGLITIDEVPLTETL
jgi:hypothetical protein